MSESFKKLFKSEKIKQIIFSTLIGISVFIVGLIFLSFLMYFFKIQSSIIYYLSYLFLFIGGFFSAKHLYHRVEGRGFLIGIIAGILNFVSAFLIGGILTDFKLGLILILTALVCLSGGLLGGIMEANK